MDTLTLIQEVPTIVLNAIETTGTINEHGHIVLDAGMALPVNGKVRVIVLYMYDDKPIPEQEWLRAASVQPVFASLAEEEELYSLADGEPFDEQR